MRVNKANNQRKPTHGLSLSQGNKRGSGKRAAFIIATVLIVAAFFLFALVKNPFGANKQTPLANDTGRNQNVAAILTQHTTNVFVSNQKNLNELKPVINAHQATLALNNCPSTNDVVNQILQKHSFSLLLALHQTGPEQCTLEQVVNAYGRPNSSTTIKGSLTNPEEVLMFFDNGPEQSGPQKPISPPQAPATVIPIAFSSEPRPTCSSQTVLSVVAHQDDDIIFMNPEHIHDTRSGYCMRSVYLTAGDAGTIDSYWLGREKGSEAAYDAMANSGPSVWIERSVTVNDHEYVTFATPKTNPNVTLVFVRLPDGNVDGSGFARTHYESLQRLENNSISTMHSVDGASNYSRDDLVNLLVALIDYFKPNELDTQTPINLSTVHSDHSDHLAAGQFSQVAYTKYAQSTENTAAPITYYTGYPIDQLPENVSGQDFSDTAKVFYSYAIHDSRLCHTPATCANTPYVKWLKREYVYTP